MKNKHDSNFNLLNAYGNISGPSVCYQNLFGMNEKGFVFSGNHSMLCIKTCTCENVPNSAHGGAPHWFLNSHKLEILEKWAAEEQKWLLDKKFT